MQSKLYVGNLAYSVTDDELRQLFSQAGEVKDAVVITDRDTRRSKGFGFIEMANEADAQKAIQMFHDHELGGRRITVNVARPREERAPRGDGGGGGGGGRRGGGGGGRRDFGGRDSRRSY